MMIHVLGQVLLLAHHQAPIAVLVALVALVVLAVLAVLATLVALAVHLVMVAVPAKIHFLCVEVKKVNYPALKGGACENKPS